MEFIGTSKLKNENQLKILSEIKQGKLLTTKQISSTVGINIVTVGTILKDLIKQDILLTKDKISQGKGRPTTQYQLNPNYFHFLSLILYRKESKTNFILRILDAHKNVLTFSEGVIDLVTKDGIISILNKELHSSTIKLIIITVPAVVSNDQIVESDIIELKHMNLQKEVEEQLGISTVIKNDMNCCAQGYHLNHPIYKNISYLFLVKDGGPGCGSIVNGQLLEGKSQIAGEIIYLPFLEFFEKGRVDYSMENVAKTIACLVSILNPEKILITGDAVVDMDILKLNSYCQKYLPNQFIPKLEMKSDYFSDYYKGINEIAINEFWGRYSIGQRGQ